MSSRIKKIINLTPHTVVVCGEEGTKAEIPPSGHVARVSTTETPAGTLPLLEGQSVPLVCREWGEVQLPTPEEVGVDDPTSAILIVSSLVGEAIKAKGLPDEWRGAIVVAPDTGPQSAVRDEDGRIVGVRRFVLYASPSSSSSHNNVKEVRS